MRARFYTRATELRLLTDESLWATPVRRVADNATTAQVQRRKPVDEGQEELVLRTRKAHIFANPMPLVS